MLLVPRGPQISQKIEPRVHCGKSTLVGGWVGGWKAAIKAKYVCRHFPVYTNVEVFRNKVFTFLVQANREKYFQPVRGEWPKSIFNR